MCSYFVFVVLGISVCILFSWGKGFSCWVGVSLVVTYYAFYGVLFCGVGNKCMYFAFLGQGILLLRWCYVGCYVVCFYGV
jgi:hypothetical protein